MDMVLSRLHLLLFLGLVASPAVATTARAQHQHDLPASLACDPASLATQVSLFCSQSEKPTGQCCEAVVAAVGLGWRVPCLCRVAAEPRLTTSTGVNATGLLALYTACGGLRPVGAHLADACEGMHLAATAPVAAAAANHSWAQPGTAVAVAAAACRPRTIAYMMVDYLYHEHTVESCTELVASVDLGGGVLCLCRAAAEQAALIALLNATGLLAIYAACGGVLHTGGAANLAAAAYDEGTRLLAPAVGVQLESTSSSSSAPCDSSALGAHVSLFCLGSALTPQCCEPVVAAVDIAAPGDLPCLGKLQMDLTFLTIGYGIDTIAEFYAACGGLRPGGARLADVCEGGAPPLPSPPPRPPSEKLLPQQHDGAVIRTRPDTAACCGLRMNTFCLQR